MWRDITALVCVNKCLCKLKLTSFLTSIGFCPKRDNTHFRTSICMSRHIDDTHHYIDGHEQTYR